MSDPEHQPASEVVWRPSGAYLEARVRQLMRRHGIDSYAELVRRSAADIAWFWKAALEHLELEWYEPYHTVLDDSRGIAWTRWFLGGSTNIVLNCVDRHVRPDTGQPDALAFVWEGDDGEIRRFTYAELDREVCRAAGAMKALGVGLGDTIGLYLPMVPEVVFAMLAAMKIGAVPIPVFSGFGAEALAARLDDAKAVLLVTADGGLRRGKRIEIKRSADEALARAPSVRSMLVLRRTGHEVPMTAGRDVWWHDALEHAPDPGPTERLEAEARALILYTSGTTGRPKGTVHTHAGCLAQMNKELAYYMDVRRGDRFFWFTDIGWMMGPWEIIGVLSLGASILIYEGAPNWPNGDRLWEMVERHELTHLGISPTGVRLLIREGDALVEKHPMATLRMLGSTGEPWDPESWSWFFDKVGRRRCPIINISGGTEIVGCLLAPSPLCELKPTTLGGPGLGMDVDVFDEAGQPVRGGVGSLVCKKPAPSMTKGFLNDPERYLETYFSRWPGIWYHGDWARVDPDGFWFLHGRADDTIKVAGKRLGPGEVESALMEHRAVSEAAAIGVPDDLKGESVACFVVLKPGFEAGDALREELRQTVAQVLGKSLKPSVLKFVAALPKTRSAKIVRGAIRRVFLGEAAGDTSSVENPEALKAIAEAR